MEYEPTACDTVLLDLGGAFDSTNHKIFMSRLRTSIGVSNIAFHWFTSYLFKNRSQRVLVVSVVNLITFICLLASLNVLV